MYIRDFSPQKFINLTSTLNSKLTGSEFYKYYFVENLLIVLIDDLVKLLRNFRQFIVSDDNELRQLWIYYLIVELCEKLKSKYCIVYRYRSNNNSYQGDGFNNIDLLFFSKIRRFPVNYIDTEPLAGTYMFGKNSLLEIVEVDDNIFWKRPESKYNYSFSEETKEEQISYHNNYLSELLKPFDCIELKIIPSTAADILIDEIREKHAIFMENYFDDAFEVKYLINTHGRASIESVYFCIHCNTILQPYGCRCREICTEEEYYRLWHQIPDEYEKEAREALYKQSVLSFNEERRAEIAEYEKQVSLDESHM